MKQSVNFSQFVDAFNAYDRYDSFGYDGLRVIFDALEQYEEDTGEEIELDVIAICCDFNMLTIDEIIQYYSIDIDPDGDKEDQVMEYLQDNTWVLGETDDSIVFQVF
jgi:hypothetical protein